MLEPLFFVLGLANNVFLISIFLIRKYRMDILQRWGWTYLLLAIPAIYGLFLVSQEQKDMQYGMFLAIFLALLALEGIYDWILKLPFRQNWRLLIPYLCLYYSMNYGFVVMVWKTSLIGGLVMLALAIIQIVVNISTHRKSKGREP